MSSSVSLGRNLVSLKWEDFNTFVVSELATLYQKEELTDVTLFCEGRSFRAHKVLLSLWSSYFRDVFRSTTHSHPVVILRETSATDLELILRFIYQGHLLIPIEETDRFLKAAEHFQVAGLKNMRHHVPNFSYSGGGNCSSQQEDISPNIQVHNSGNMYEIGTPTKPPAGAPMTLSSHQSSPFRISGGGQTLTLSASNNNSTPINNPIPIVSQHSPSPTLDAANLMHHQSGSSENIHHQQVIRQSSSRSVRQLSNASVLNQQPCGAQSNLLGGQSVPSSNSSSVGVVTRLSSESVIYQPQPVLIFQNSSPGAPLIKPGEPHLVRGGVSSTGENRPEHSMMVIEGVVTDPSIHMQQISAPNSQPGHVTSAPAYTVYSNACTSPSLSGHNSSQEVSGNDECILGLPYHAPGQSPRSGSLSEQQHTSLESLGPPQSHHHHQQHQHSGTHTATPTQIESVVVAHPYAPSPSPHSSEPPANGNGSSDSSTVQTVHAPFKVKSNNTPNSITPEVSGPVHPAQPVYAVKRIPLPLPPSHVSTETPTSSTQSRSGKSDPSVATKGNVIAQKTKASYINVQRRSSSERTTRAKSTYDIKASLSSKSPSSQVNPSVTASSSSGTQDGKTYTSAPSNRKVQLVPCPKCGKKVKQTSLKVHIKRTHLEEGLEFIECKVCHKKISSKGVFYKHMYIHRKRSETGSKADAGHVNVKTETQGP